MVAPEIRSRIGEVLELFEPLPLMSRFPDRIPKDANPRLAHLMLAPQDFVSLIDQFYPEISPGPQTYMPDTCSVPSTSSSATGSSTLTTVSIGTESIMVSSAIPSTNGTSIVSHTVPNAVSPGTVQVSEGEAIAYPSQHLESKDLFAVKNCHGRRLRGVSNHLKRMSNSESLSNLSVRRTEWTFIHISQDGKSLSLKPTDSAISWPGSTPTHLSSIINDEDFSILKEAVIRLMIDRDAFCDNLARERLQAAVPIDDASALARLFEHAMLVSENNFDFRNALFWCKSHQIMQKNSSSLQRFGHLDSVLGAISAEIQDSIDSRTANTNHILALQRSLRNLQKSQRLLLQEIDDARNALRIKMWYTSDVRHSANYEDTLHVTRALRAMTISVRTKQSSSISNWARHRLRNSTGYDRSEAQTLEALTAHRDHGGLSKLADEQIELTSRWLTRNSIENFCKGEERIHRFCFEIQKCVSKLTGTNPLDNPILWSSRLFEREKSMFHSRHLHPGIHHPQYKNLDIKSSWNHDDLPSSQQPYTSSARSSEGFGSKFFHHTNSPDTIWKHVNSSSVIQDTGLPGQPRNRYTSDIASPLCASNLRQLPSHFIHDDFRDTISEEASSARKAFTQQVRRILLNLVISDLGYLLWANGSETDAWVNRYSFLGTLQTEEYSAEEGSKEVADVKDLGNENALNSTKTARGKIDEEQMVANPKIHHLQTSTTSKDKASIDEQIASSIERSPQDSVKTLVSDTSFPYKKAYANILDRFSFSLDPYSKLQSLSELENLVSSAILENRHARDSRKTSTTHDSISVSNRTINVPRTKATSMEEVIANCTERRASTMRSHDLQDKPLLTIQPQPPPEPPFQPQTPSSAPSSQSSVTPPSARALSSATSNSSPPSSPPLSSTRLRRAKPSGTPASPPSYSRKTYAPP